MEATASRARKGRLLPTRAYQALLARFGQDLSTTLLLQPVNGSALTDAVQVARRHALRAADALHLATALRVRNALGLEIVMTTSDAELEQAARAEGMAFLNPEDAGAAGSLLALRHNI